MFSQRPGPSRLGLPLRTAAAAIACLLLLPIAAFGVGCACDSTSCSIHQSARTRASAPEGDCHETSTAPSAPCNLTAPCSHDLAAASASFMPPAVLASAPVLIAPPVDANEPSTTGSRPCELAVPAPELPPRFLAA